MEPIIKSLLDTDYYKLTMLNCFYYYENAVPVTYKFKCRNKNVKFTENMIELIAEQIEYVCQLKLTKDEAIYLRSIPNFNESFVRFMEDLTLRATDVKMNLNNEGVLDITIKGPVIYTSLWEIYLLSIVNEVYFGSFYNYDKTNEQYREYVESGLDTLNNKLKSVEHIAGFTFSEFGTRRRFSRDYHELVIKRLIESKQCVGTSNVDFARRYNLKPIGTMAHEWIMFHMGLTHMNKANKLAMDRWQEFYEGDLGTALTDTITTDYFLKSFNGTLARAFDGWRHDSGDPVEWTNKMINHCKKLNVDYKNKLFLYSDGLDFSDAVDIYMQFVTILNKISFGIGTRITNDIPGLKPLNIIIKMVECNKFPTIKLSDSPGKIMCEDKVFADWAEHFYRGNYITTSDMTKENSSHNCE